MALPGFNAEASLYRTSEPYKEVGTVAASARQAAVVPQACVNLGPCRICLVIIGIVPRACFTISCPGGINKTVCP